MRYARRAGCDAMRCAVVPRCTDAMRGQVRCELVAFAGTGGAMLLTMGKPKGFIECNSKGCLAGGLVQGCKWWVKEWVGDV